MIIASLLEMVPAPLSFHAIGKRAGVSSKTVEDYLELFEDLFILKTVYYIDRGKILFRKEKKFFFRDLLISKAVSLWVRKDFLYEWIVQEHLYRKFGEIYYYRNSYEIDCIAGNLKVEVKAGKPYRRYPRNVIVLEEEDIPRFLRELFN